MSKEKKVGFFDKCKAIFNCSPRINLEDLFTEGKIRYKSIEVAGKSVEQLKQELIKNGIRVGSVAEQMMKSPDFTTSEFPKVFNLVILKVGDMGFKYEPTTAELYKRAEELGLALCPPQIGPELRLIYTDQPIGERIYIPTEKLISDSRNKTHTFAIDRYDSQLWLHDRETTLDSSWNRCDSVVFLSVQAA